MLSLRAKDIMTRDVVTVKKGASINQALMIMSQHNVSGVPVVDVDNNLQGIITESDVLLKGQFTPAEKSSKPNGIFGPSPDGIDEAYRRARASTVEEAMTTKVLVFAEESLVVDIARAMIEHAVNRVPIVQRSQVVGNVSRRDVVRAMARAANGTQSDDEVRVGKLIEL